MAFTPFANPWKDFTLVGAFLDNIQTYLQTGLPADYAPINGTIAASRLSGYPSDATKFIDGSGAWRLLASGDIPTLAASKVSGGVGLQLICDSVLSAPAASFDTNTILGGNIPQTYKHLKMVLSARGDTAAQRVGVNVQFNGDTAANYTFEALGADTNTTPTSSFNGSSTFGPMSDMPGSTAPANVSGLSEYLVGDYASTTFFKNCSGNGTNRYSATASLQQVIGFTWSSTAAIVRIVVSPNSGNFIAGSRFTLYGLN